jgi:phosphatidylserine/phosphatidylglycerophosphate/cardiolipin synthase-like enzyme
MGSSNLDGFSTWQDDEVALQIKGATFAKQVESRIFAIDIPKSKKLDTAPPHDDSIKNRVLRKAEPELDAAAVVFAAR